ADAAAADGGDAATAGGPPGDPGLTVRIIEDRPTVTRVRKGSAGERAGIRPGFIVTHIGGPPLRARARPGPAPRPVGGPFSARLAAARRLAGPAGSKVTIRMLDLDDRPVEAMLERDAPRGRPVRVGLLPPLYPELHVSQIGDVTVVAFNF